MRGLLATIAIAGILGCADGARSTSPPTGPSFAAFANTDQTVIQLHALVFDPCTNEDVLLDGPIHIVFHITVNAAGGLLLNGQANFQGVSGVGSPSGLKYQLVGRSIRGFDGPLVISPGGGSVGLFVLNQMIVSQGSTLNESFHFTVVFVVNANGDVTANVANITATCKG